ncbi:hypothetical protein COCNU_07G006740 [Cocos nucifera]|uniref:Uncharacterized protein n=1 Tax=Cocos nucifera TaxID=13894 RepID=A0A8K0N4T2_COCNU|nr:hypothetical protein COCNU_07G006740 [Cocos nucifera]
MDGMELKGDVEALGICKEVHGGDIEKFLLVVNDDEVEVGQSFQASMEGLEEDGSLGGIRGGTVEVDDVDHTLPLHCLEDGLIENEEGEVDKETEAKEVAVDKEGLRH